MKRILLGVILALALAGEASALALRWDAVTMDTAGVPLSSSLLPTAYRVYKCNTPAASCLKAQAALLATVPAPTTTFNIDAQPFPASYFVTAVNIVGESAESGTVKAVPPDRPRNEGLQTQ